MPSADMPSNSIRLLLSATGQTACLSLALLLIGAAAPRAVAQTAMPLAHGSGAANQEQTATYVFTIEGELKRVPVKPRIANKTYLVQGHRTPDGHPPLPVRRSDAKRGRTTSLIAVTSSQLSAIRRGATVTRAATASTDTAATDIAAARRWTAPARPESRTIARSAAPQVIRPTRSVDGSAATPRGQRIASAQAPDAGSDAWSNDEITAGREACARIIARSGAIVRPIPPIKKGPCGDPAPVMLIGFDGRNPVTLSKPARVNCRMVGALRRWLDEGLQPAAAETLNARVAKINVMSGYSCRNTYGRKDTKLSQHALANALDISGFTMTSGKRANLLAHWGLTRRDIVARAKAEAAKVAAAKAAGEAAQNKTARAAAGGEQQSAKAETTETASAQGDAVMAGRNLADRAAAALSAGGEKLFGYAPGDELGEAARRMGFRPPSRLGGPKAKSGGTSSTVPVAGGGQPPPRAQRRFLKAAFDSACRIFGTVLGPEANEAHRNHFHVDLAPRRRSNYCR